ncbi:DUF6166 domain-containing protein [Mycobacterium xenopi]|uniref:DUF6166 domain-containing protein n=1 Tax=Mycobacterium xenopi TaxID=1789 RepID=UPI000D8924B0|nr:Uncharacterised protein [Mycobacterium xenopi]
MLPRHIGSTPSPLPNHGEISYRGYGPYCPAGGRLVVIEIDGEVIGPLPHAVKHSPTGMTWGYCGSGPADLARSLLIHALGDDARCTVCEGTGEVVYDITTDREIPSRHADLEHLNPGESDRILGRKPRHLWRGEPIPYVAGRSPAVKEVGLGRRCIA